MIVKGIATATLALGLLACTQTNAPQPPQPVVGLDSAFVEAAGNSPAVFRGIVLARPGSTTDGVAASRLTTLVRVDSLHQWGTAVDITAADTITVVVRDTLTLNVNTRYGFLANGLAVDSGVVVRENWKQVASTAAEWTAFIDAYNAAVPLALDRETRAHLPRIDVVFWGVVTAIQPPQISDSISRISRHSESAPSWRVATIIPRGVLRGSPGLISQPTPVLFPGSRQLMFAAVPRPGIADVRLYLLHRPGRLAGFTFAGIDTSRTFVLFDPLDVRPLGDTTRVARLLKLQP